jgi:hypothetical protein
MGRGDQVSMTSAPRYKLPPLADQLIGAAAAHFNTLGEVELVTLLANCKIEVEEGTFHDNWDGGIDGHDINLILAPQLFSPASTRLEAHGKRVEEFVNKIANVPGEVISTVRFSLDLTHISPDWRESTGRLLNPPTLTPSNSNDEARLWGDSPLRVFLSHKADFRVEVSALKDHLLARGVASFVAHEDIEPSKKWKIEIEKALATMHVLVSIHSLGFRESAWANQEVGVALGRGVPTFSFQIGEDPCGFVSDKQAIRNCSIIEAEGATSLARLFMEETNLGSKYFDALMACTASASTWDQAGMAVEWVEEYGDLKPEEKSRFLQAVESNTWIRTSYRAKKALKRMGY